MDYARQLCGPSSSVGGPGVTLYGTEAAAWLAFLTLRELEIAGAAVFGEDDPKPLYYREAFLDEQLTIYQREKALAYVAEIEPDDFVRWMFPRLFYSRLPRYQAIADAHGYTITTEELKEVKDEQSFLRVIERALDRNG